MLRICRAAARSPAISAKRYAHGVHYSAPEPLLPYLKWIAVIGGFCGLVVYDRVYSNGAITKLVTPETNVREIEARRERVADLQVQERDRNVELLFPRRRSPAAVYTSHPVPQGSHRASFSSDVIDPNELGARRPRDA